MPQSGIDVHNQQRPPVETVAKVVGHGYPLGSKEVHRTCHRRCQRSPHIDQWFDKSTIFSNHGYALTWGTCLLREKRDGEPQDWGSNVTPQVR